MTDRHRHSRHRAPALAATACALLLTALPALTGCESEPDKGEGKAADGPGVIAPGKPGEKARTLSPKDARKASGGDTKPNAADVTYATTMIQHHQQALVMTALAPERAVGKGVRKLASRIGAAQGPEIKAMRGWLKSNGHGGHEKGHDGHDGGHDGHAGMPGMATEAQLDKLRAAKGKAFDELFLTLMTTHHRGAVTMAVQLLENGNDVRVEEMATDVMAQQKSEIRRMRKLR
ncbi:DUF305 domain-containing protein [Streptomyces sp. NPDC048172]|uniref:DUF305 domain-containing protein n=1 Tax=Streptomyces sp. NPDC048172 TaxID=3365505 RepID=UPI003715F97A